MDGVHEADRFLFADGALIYTERWREWMRQSVVMQNGDTKAWDGMQGKFFAVGITDIDQLNLVDRERERQERGIPTGKKVVLVLPFGFGTSPDRYWSPNIFRGMPFWKRLFFALLSGRPRWIRQAILNIDDRHVLLAVRRFCDANNAWMIVKSRRKDPVPSYVNEIADQVLYDETYYPATIFRLMAIADFCIHFSSSAVLEAAAAGTASLGILPSDKDFSLFRQRVWPHFVELYNVPGVTYTMSPEEAIQRLPTAKLSDWPLDAVARERFLRTYVADQPRHATSGAVDCLEQLVEAAHVSA